jgi:PAS domain S-box-containing protein
MDVILIATNDGETKESLDVILGNSSVILQATKFHKLVELLQDNPIDVAIVDEILDGRRIFDELTSILEAARYVPVVALTAEPKSTLVRDYLALGVWDVLQKPLLEEDVIASVQKALEHVRLHKSVEFFEQAKADEESPLRAIEERFVALSRTNLSMARNTHTASFGSFHKALVNIRDVQRLFELIVEALTDVFPLTNAALVLRDEGCQTLAVKACKGLDEEFVKQLKFDAKEGITLWLRRNGGILLTEEKGEGISGEELAEIRKEADLLRAKACVPLSSDGKVLGFFSVGSKINGERFGDDELQSMFQLAKYVAGAIENAISYDEIGSRKTKLESIVQYASTGIVAVDAEGRIIATNEKAADLLGVTSEQVVGNHAQKLGSVFSDILMQTLMEKKTCSNEKVMDPVSKSPLMVSTSLLKNGKGENVGAVMLLTDIISLPEGADIRFGEMIKIELLSDILSDTIGNSLVPISTLNQTARGKHDLEELAERAEKEVEDLVNFMEIFAEFADLSISDREHDMVQFLNDWVRTKSNEVRKKRVTIELESELTNQVAFFDPERLGQALEKIVENSIESFSKNQEGKRIEIFARGLYETNELKQIDAIEISITDNGRGIDEKKIKSVFEPFYSYGKGSKRLGLGLSIARKIIEMHGGSIEIKNQEGGGTIVRIIFPKKNGSPN